MAYRLWYWPGIQGRGEFVRLLLEAAALPYEDAARVRGVDALIADMRRGERPPFAPPYLEVDGRRIAQVANIVRFLGERHGFAPADPLDRAWQHELQLTVTDMVAEIHDVHHPVANGAYYEDQKAEAARAAAQFRAERLPKFLGWFEDAIAGEWTIGDRWTGIDLSLFQLVAGLRYMFPRRMAAVEAHCPKLIGLHDRVTAIPGVAAYLASDRRVPFNTNGIFRHYPELDAA